MLGKLQKLGLLFWRSIIRLFFRGFEGLFMDALKSSEALILKSMFHKSSNASIRELVKLFFGGIFKQHKKYFDNF